tara:strand:+ start:512 stop:676 length:165 start_codon:yes stop_codon:yes gene_type:complete
MQKLYRGNKTISVEIRIPLKEGLYRGFRHENKIDKIIINKSELRYRGAKYNIAE